MLAPRLRRFGFVLAAFCLLLSFQSKAQWSTKLLSEGRGGLSSGTVGTKVFFAGGFPISDKIEVYNDADQSLTTATLPVARYLIGIASFGTKIIFAGGSTPTGTTAHVDIYDDGNGSWSTANLSAARYSVKTAVVGTKILFVGGFESNGSPSNVVDIYNNGVWTTATLSSKRKIIGAATVGNRVYIVGENDMDIYDNSNNSWTTRQMSVTAEYGSMVSLGTRLFITASASNARVKTVAIFDTASSLWDTHNIHLERSEANFVVNGNRVFLAGGFYNASPTDVVDIYDASIDTWATVTLSRARTSIGTASVGNKVLFAGGAISGGQHRQIDIYDNSCVAPVLTHNDAPFVVCNGLNYSNWFFNGADTYNATGGTMNGNALTIVAATAGRISVTGTKQGCFAIKPIDVTTSGSLCPWITSFTPTSATPGSLVRITGVNLTPDFVGLTFNGVAPTKWKSATSTQLEVYVPENANTGPLRYKIGAYTAESAQTFTVICGFNDFSTSPNQTICKGGKVELYAVGYNVFSVSWSPSNGLSSTIGNYVEARPTVTTEYTVTGKTQQGCAETRTILVTVNPPCVPVITSFEPKFAASGDKVIVTGLNLKPSTGRTRIRFYDGNTGSSQNVDDTSTDTRLVVTVPGGVQTGKFTVENDNGSVISSENLVICPSRANVTLTQSTTVCSGGSIKLTASGATTYSWLPAPGLPPDSGGGATTGSSVTVTPTQTTTYTVTGTVAGGCSDTKTVTITVIDCKSSRLGRFGVDKIAGCVPLTVNVLSTTNMPGATCNGTCSINYGESGMFPTTARSYTYNKPGTYKIAISYSDGLSDDITITAGSNPQIKPNAGTTCSGQPVLLEATGADTYVWGDGSTGNTLAVAPSVTTNYTVVGTTVAGCTGSATATITVYGNCPPFTATLAAPSNSTAPGAISPLVLLTSGGINPNRQMILYHRPMISGDYVAEPTQSFTQTASVPVQSAWLDELGMEFYFTVTDASGIVAKTETGWRQRVPMQAAVPHLDAGSSQNDYNIFSVPRQLPDPRVKSVMSTFFARYGGMDETKWRFVRYENGKNVNFSDGLLTIEPGKGYWLLSPQKISLYVMGTAIPITRSEPFQFRTDQGWNQIGSPYEFDVSWESIKTLNSGAATLGDLFVFNPATGSFKKSDVLKAWGGGFINTTAHTEIKFPVNVSKASARTYSDTYAESNIDSDNWFIGLNVEHGGSRHDMGGVGMNRDASITRDYFDESALPRLANYLDINFAHPEYFQKVFMRDVVPTTDKHEWNFTVESNYQNGPATISWNTSSLAGQKASVLLYDPASGILIDMKKSGAYSFELKQSRNMTIIYGKSEKDLSSSFLRAGTPYPNPFREKISIPFIVADHGAAVQATIYDLTGRRIRTLNDDKTERGFHEILWDGSDVNGTREPNGIYIVELTDQVTSVKMKVVIN